MTHRQSSIVQMYFKDIQTVPASVPASRHILDNPLNRNTA